MIAKAFTPVFGDKPFMIMGAPTFRLPPPQDAVLLQRAVLLQALRAAAGDADHPYDGEDADVSAGNAAGRRADAGGSGRPGAVPCGERPCGQRQHHRAGVRFLPPDRTAPGAH